VLLCIQQSDERVNYIHNTQHATTAAAEAAAYFALKKQNELAAGISTTNKASTSTSH
jgi:hypothetical protein